MIIKVSESNLAIIYELLFYYIINIYKKNKFCYYS